MDPLTHTLLGVTLSESGLKRWTPLATATLVIGVNLPDIDGVANLMGRDSALWIRRGWTHGVVAMTILPLLLAGAMYGWSRWRRTPVDSRRSHGPPHDRTEAHVGRLVALSHLSVLSHPALDWLNNYGVRLLMPFDGRWFYGDAVFIMDPWLWLLLGTSGVLAYSRSWVGLIGWTALAVVATVLMLTVEPVPMAARALWMVGVAGLCVVRAMGAERRLATTASVCLAVAVVYIVATVAATGLARRQVDGWLASEHIDAEAVMAGPVPANPFRRQVVVDTGARYHFLTLDWLASEPLSVSGPSVEKRPMSPAIATALAAPSVRGLRGWLRFPAYEVEAVPEGFIVRIADMRFPRITGLGTATIELDAAGALR